MRYFLRRYYFYRHFQFIKQITIFYNYIMNVLIHLKYFTQTNLIKLLIVLKRMVSNSCSNFFVNKQAKGLRNRYFVDSSVL